MKRLRRWLQGHLWVSEILGGGILVLGTYWIQSLSLPSLRVAPENLTCAFPLATALLIGGLLGGAGGAIGGKKQKKTTTKITPFDLSTLLPPGMEFLAGAAGPSQQAFRDAILQLLQTAAHPDLDPAILSRMLGDIAGGFHGAQDAAARSAALGFGPMSLSPAQVAISQARAEAQTRAGFGLESAQNRRQNLALLGPILSFLQGIQGIRMGAPQKTTVTRPGVGAASGFFSGAAQGVGLGKMFGGGGGGSVGAGTGPWSGGMNLGNMPAFDASQGVDFF